jgi:hypothetical protein
MGFPRDGGFRPAPENEKTMRQILLAVVCLLLLTDCDSMCGGWHQESPIEFTQVPAAVMTQFRVDHPDAAVDRVELCEFGQENGRYYEIAFHPVDPNVGLPNGELCNYLPDGTNVPPSAPYLRH